MKIYLHNKYKPMVIALAFASASLFMQPVMAQSSGSDDDTEVVEEIMTIGSRSHRERTISDSPVPIDVLSADDLKSMGGIVDLTDSLKNLIPSYTATRASGDTSAYVRPTSLRGTAPDQTLVLVNGKRRHRSSVIQFFAPAAGSGSHGVDIAMIPSIALKRIEVLRDGASAQYGSDAIAGVINFVTRDNREGGEYQIRYGQHFEGGSDEANYTLSANQGFGLGEDGFVNLSLEYQSNDALSRGLQRPAAQENIDNGAIGVGEDSPFGDGPLVQTFGRVETSGTRFFLNSGLDINDSTSWYGRVGYADTKGRFRFFYRALNAVDEALEPLVDLGYDGDLLLTGYTPYLDGTQKDISISTGVKGEFDGGTTWDVSFGYGKNTMDLFLNREINPSLGLTPLGQIPQFAFKTGGYEQEELLFNADFSTAISDSINLAYGAEWRDEAWTTNAGEQNAWADANGVEGAGVDGRIGPSDAGTWDRSNYAVYVDIEHDITERLLLQYAARYEDFTDFGGVLTGKLAGRFRVTDSFAFRGAVSTGFKAPTPGQANVRATVSSADPATGILLIQGLVPVTDPRAIAAGATPLTEETTLNLSAGMTAEPFENTSVTLDFYQISVDDRIYRTDRIEAGDGSTISFFTNTLDVEHSGVDLVVTSVVDWGSDESTSFSFAYNYNKTDVTQVRSINGFQPVQDDAVEDIEINFPEDRFVASANTFFNDQWSLMLRANYYGEHFDTRGRVGGVDGEAPSKKLSSTIFVDLELAYRATENLTLKLGGSNIFDEFPDTVGPPYANRLNIGLQYPSETPANFEGGSWYVTANYAF